MASAEPFTVRNIEVATAAVEVKSISVNAKQMTLSMFRQLVEEPLVDDSTGEVRGVPWGWVNYCPDKTCADVHEHLHVVWQKESLLRRAVMSESAPQMSPHQSRLRRKRCGIEMEDWYDTIAVDLWIESIVRMADGKPPRKIRESHQGEHGSRIWVWDAGWAKAGLWLAEVRSSSASSLAYTWDQAMRAIQAGLAVPQSQIDVLVAEAVRYYRELGSLDAVRDQVTQDLERECAASKAIVEAYQSSVALAQERGQLFIAV